MASFDGPVCLTQAAPDAAYAGHIFIYDVVHPDVVSRSGVLSSIVEAGGDVKLPDTVKLSDFKAWCIATTTTAEDVQHMELRQTCSMLLVADALDDRCFDEWFKLTVDILRRFVSNRSVAPDPQHVMSDLSTLPHHLRQRVLGKLAEEFCDISSTSLTFWSIDASLKILAPAIATFTSLQSITLGTDSSSDSRGMLDADDLPGLKVALQPMSCLQDLTLCFSNRKRKSSRNSTSAETPEPQHCLSNMLSTVTALTSLHINEEFPWARSFLTAQAPLTLPCLKHLKVFSQYHNALSAILSQLNAPLVCVETGSELAHDWMMEDLPRAQRLWSGLGRSSQLLSLSIGLELCADSVETKRVLSAGAPQAVASLVSLQELDVSGDLFLLLPAVQHLTASDSGVRRLCLGISPDLETRQPASAERWHDFLLQLSRLKLHHLRMSIHWRALEPGVPGLAALQTTTQLTALHVSHWRTCLDSQEDCESLRRMQQLQSLYIDEFTVPRSVHADCIGALGALPSLKELGLSDPSDLDPTLLRAPSPAFEHGFMASFMQHAPGAGWPTLQFLGLPLRLSLFGADLEGYAESIIRTVAAFPSLQNFMFGYVPHSRSEDEHMHARLARFAADFGATFNIAFDRYWSRFDWQSEFL